jgi:hypothetical protein
MRWQALSRPCVKSPLDCNLVYSSTTDDFLFPDNAFAGAIPTEVGQLAQLERLALGSNELTGTPKKLA